MKKAIPPKSLHELLQARKPAFNPLFSIIVIGLLFVELFSPITYAADPTPTVPPTPSGTASTTAPSSGAQTGSADCFANSLSPSQTKAFWDATFGFVGQELNALSYQELLQNKAGAIANQPQNLTVNIDTDSGKLYAVEDVAQVMGRDPKQVAEDLNADVNGSVDLRTVKAYMAAKPGPQGALEKLLGIRPKLQVEKPAFDNYKIVLPNQRSMSLREVFALEELDSQSSGCLLDQSDIRGKVHYVALLGKDLFIGFDQSSTTANSNQHLASTSTFSALTLNGGSSIVIPKRYLDYASFVKNVLEIDTLLTIGETGMAFTTRNAIENNIKNRREAVEEANQLKGINFGPTGGNTADDMASEMSQFEQGAAGATTLPTKGFEKAQQALGKHLADIYNPDDLGKVCQTLTGSPFVGPGCKAKLARNFAILTGRFYNNFALGMLWLGPGRLALGAANAISFSSNDRRFSDNYLQIFVDRPVAQDFKRATNWMLSGPVIDMISDFTRTGVPRAVYGVGPVYIVNFPEKKTTNEEASASLTSLTTDVEQWTIATNWKGRSTSTNFEDIRNKNDYARVSLYSNNMTLGATLERKQEFASYYELLLYAAPLLSWKFLKFPPEEEQLFIILSRVAFTDLYISHLVDPAAMKPDEICDDKEVNKWKTFYTVTTAASQLQNILLFPSVSSRITQYAGTLKTKFARNTELANQIKKDGEKVTALEGHWKRALDTLQILSPLEVAKMWAASAGFQYVSNCKDTSYTILGYQPLETKPKGGVSALKDKLNPLGVDKIAGNLSLGNALQGVGKQIDKEQMNEIINLRTVMQDQSGMVTPTKLYYLHLDGATQEWWGVYEQVSKKGCFRKCIDGNVTAICMTQDGVEMINKLTGERTKLADKDHALMSQFLPQLASTIIPNTIITAKMNCGAQETIMQARSDSHLYSSGSCGTVNCMIAQLSQLSGTTVGSDLSQVLGNVKAIHTTTGIATIENGVIKFIRTSGTETELKGIGTTLGTNEEEKMAEDERSGTLTTTRSLIGTETRIPSLDTERQVDSGAVQGNIYSSSSIQIQGDGKVTGSGYSGTTEMGELLTINLEKGRIENDRAGQRLLVALYVLGEVNAPESIKSISVAATNNVDENGQETPAIRIDNVQAKPGQEEFTQSFNNGLQQVQGEGGMQMFDTADKTYYFTTDAAGNPVLRILDKKTGKYEDYPITGQITSDGSTVTVPTDQGPFSFNLSMNDKGQPTLTVNGPDGYKDIATLLAARGQNGIIIFDPATGTFRALNGQDLSLNRDFATKGLTYLGSPEGVRGVPTDNFLDFRQRGTGGDSGGAGLLALPGFPENAVYFTAMLAAILLGVIAVRIRQTGRGAPARKAKK